MTGINEYSEFCIVSAVNISVNNKSKPLSLTQQSLVTVYNSWIADKIDDYNSSFYYDSADCIYQSYLIGKPL